MNTVFSVLVLLELREVTGKDGASGKGQVTFPCSVTRLCAIFSRKAF